ncbi:MAG TPA: hypothetical protein VMA95_14830 [Streptosporangiaceae bacterium]|nr:hypothetical protein [Streptosporangiaceae bacterium]
MSTGLSECADAAGQMSGAAEALAVLTARGPRCRERAAAFAVSVLTRWADPADWASAGLAGRPASARGLAGCPCLVPVSHHAVLRLARSAMALRVSDLTSAVRPACWERLAAFMRSRVPHDDRELGRIEESGLRARVDAGDTSAEVLRGLAAALERHRAFDGEDAYATGVTRLNLALAYAGADLARASSLAVTEEARRTALCRAAHPAVLEARGFLAGLLLARAEAEPELRARRELAQQALAEADLTRSAWDRLLGVTSEGAIASRALAGHALLLLGELGKARVCLECALAFDARRAGARDDQCRGRISVLLARVHAAAGDHEQAIGAAGRALRILGQDAPGSPAYQHAAAFARELAASAGALYQPLVRNGST